MFTRWEASGIFSGKGTIDIFGENVDCVPIPSLPPTKTRGVSFIFTAVSLYKMYNLSICFEAMRKLVEGSDTHVAGEGYSCSVQQTSSSFFDVCTHSCSACSVTRWPQAPRGAAIRSVASRCKLQRKPARTGCSSGDTSRMVQ